VRDLAEVQQVKIIDIIVAKAGMEMISIDEHGLDDLDRKILNIMYNSFKGGPVGLNTLAAALSEDIDTIREVYEPFLITEGFIARSPKGRIITEKTIKYLKI
jgi:Holliday junction DNA helicase RuvB